MFKLETLALEVITLLRPVVEGIARRDAGLADQARRALNSVALNAGEGSGSQGRNGRARYFTALGSAREVRTAIRVAHAWGYVAPIDAVAADRLDHVIAILWRLTH